MGLEGLVSKHRDRPYRGDRQKHWIKVKKSEASSDVSRDGYFCVTSRNMRPCLRFIANGEALPQGMREDTDR